MKPKKFEQDRQHAFDSYCKKVLKNDARNSYREMRRIWDREVVFSGLTDQEFRRLSTTDKYFIEDQVFDVLGWDVIVSNAYIADALRCLPKKKRDIILLSYFLELTDREIGEGLKMKRSTVQNQRKNTLLELRRIMEEETIEE